MTSADHLLELHGAVIQGDPAALEQVWVELWQLLRPRLQRCPASADLVEDAVNDAIWAYLEDLHAFEPSRGSLGAFVYGVAKNMVRDRLRAAGRKAEREKAYAIHRQAYAPATADYLTLGLQAQEIRSALPRVCDPNERAAIEAYLDSGEETAAAPCLGPSHLPPAEQLRAVKRLCRASSSASSGFSRESAPDAAGPGLRGGELAGHPAGSRRMRIQEGESEKSERPAADGGPNRRLAANT